jgi:thiol-disulfide isomerase/thioredoxin
MHLDAMRGEPFVLNLWATWCPPCQREMPMMADVAARSPIPVFFINQGEDAPKIRAFLNDRRLTEATVLVDTRGALGSALQAPALPTTLFVDATGQVRVRHSGEISRAALTATIRNLERNPP